MARGRRFPVRTGPRRKSVWLAFQPGQDTITAASTALFVGQLSAADLALRPFTIVRTRGVIHYRSDQVAASEAYGMNYGMAVVSDQASAIGVTAIPTPVTDMSSDLWFLMQQMTSRFEFADATGFIESGQVLTYDSKAMRKVDIGEDVVVVAETASVHLSCRFIDSFRMLVKLH